jgi:hypothetical protein
MNCAVEYANMVSQGMLQVTKASITMETLNEIFDKMFKCLIKTTRPGKDGMVTMDRVELLWKEREEETSTASMNEHAFLLADFLNHEIDVVDIEENNLICDEVVNFDI